jgi:hypothetical protein
MQGLLDKVELMHMNVPRLIRCGDLHEPIWPSF